MRESILMCATDAGGVRNLAPVLERLHVRGYSASVVTRKRLRFLWGDTPKQVGKVKLLDDYSREEELQFYWRATGPSHVLCGTTCFDSPDRLFIRNAMEAGIPCVAVVDEWYNYAQRFRDEETGELGYLPHAVALPDRVACEEAVTEGIPPNVCVPTGNPALAAWIERVEGFPQNPPASPVGLETQDNRTIITFFSETIAADYGITEDMPGRMGPFIGYTERSVLQDLLKVLASLDDTFLLVDKQHPATSNPSALGQLPSNVEYMTMREVDLAALLWHSRFAVGMRSMGLLEAHLMGCPVVSYQPDRIGTERCTAVRLGLVQDLGEPLELEAWIRDVIDSTPHPNQPSSFPFASAQSADNIIDTLMSVAPYAN